MRSLAVIATVVLLATASTAVHAVPVADTTLNKVQDSGFDVVVGLQREYTERDNTVNVPVRSIDPERKRLYLDKQEEKAKENKDPEDATDGTIRRSNDGVVIRRDDDGVVIRRSIREVVGKAKRAITVSSDATGLTIPDPLGNPGLIDPPPAPPLSIPAVNVALGRRQNDKGGGPSRDGAL